MQECQFIKKKKDTPLQVYYSGNIRVSGCRDCCSRWFFTFNGVECTSPAPIEAALYQAKALNNIHQPVHIEGFCGDVPAGDIKLEVRVGECVGTGKPLGDAYTGFATTSRIFINELWPEMNIYYG